MTDIATHIWTGSGSQPAKEEAWIRTELSSAGRQTIETLIARAVDARKRAYEPYSHYKVGCAILCVSGAVHTGCNAEVVSYTETDHAERSAISRCIAEGEMEKSGRKFIRIVAISHTSPSGPCGGCRQRIAEHCDNAVIIDLTPEGAVKLVSSLGTLLPYSFTPTHLGIE